MNKNNETGIVDGTEPLQDTPLDTDFVDFAVERSTPLKVSMLNVGDKVPPCEVVLQDCLTCNQTEKLKMLEGYQDNNHSVPPHQLNDNSILEDIVNKAPINWPKATDEVSWEKLESLVHGKLTKTILIN